MTPLIALAPLPRTPVACEPMVDGSEPMVELPELRAAPACSRTIDAPGPALEYCAGMTR